MNRIPALVVAVAAATNAMLAGGAYATIAPLEGRTIAGTAVASGDSSAMFEFDPNLNITWLRDWNANGPMDWDTAKAWAAALSPGGFTGWRLPSAADAGGSTTCYGFDCSNSEMGYMWYTELGNAHSLTNTGDFQKFQSYIYWLDRIQPGNGYPFAFYTGGGLAGYQGDNAPGNPLYAVAVRNGDVLTAVPEPDTLATMLAGLIAVTLVARRRR